jgi:predicted phosphatase
MANMAALVSSVSDQDIQGEVMGIYSSVEALAQGIPAVISGYIATLAVWMPSVVASAMMVLGGLLFWVTFRPSMIRHE